MLNDTSPLNGSRLSDGTLYNKVLDFKTSRKTLTEVLYTIQEDLWDLSPFMSVKL